MIFSLLLSALAAASTAAALTALPTQDPFYQQPSNISSYAPGDVIRSRNVTNQISGFVAGGASESIQAAWQYFYRTTDSLGQPVAAMTTLLVPHNADPKKLLIYNTAYDSTDNNCVPSYSLQAGANSTTGADFIFIAASLDKGWYVATSDYEGLQTQLLAGIQSGQAVLDSVRATFHQANTSGLSPNATYSMFGYSGGSFASEWAAELQAKYAPELKFQGVAIGGVPANLTHSLLVINGGVNSPLAFEAIAGLSRAYSNLSDYVNNALIPARKAEFQSYTIGCMSNPNLKATNKDVFSFFKNGSALLSDAVPRSILQNAGQMGNHGTPRMPLFVFKAIGDEIAPVSDTDDLVAKYCSQGGVTIEYHRDLIGGHASEAVTGSADAFAWISDRMDGKPVANAGTCVTKTVALTTISIKDVAALGASFIAALQGLLGGSLGPPS